MEDIITSSASYKGQVSLSVFIGSFRIYHSQSIAQCPLFSGNDTKKIYRSHKYKKFKGIQNTNVSGWRYCTSANNAYYEPLEVCMNEKIDLFYLNIL